MSDDCPNCAFYRNQILNLTSERQDLTNRLMAALSPPAYQAYQAQGQLQGGPVANPDLVPTETVVDSEGQAWVRVAGRLVKQEDWKKAMDGAVYLDEAGRPVPAEEVNRAMDMLDSMIGGGKL